MQRCQDKFPDSEYGAPATDIAKRTGTSLKLLYVPGTWYQVRRHRLYTVPYRTTGTCLVLVLRLRDDDTKNRKPTTTLCCLSWLRTSHVSHIWRRCCVIHPRAGLGQKSIPSSVRDLTAKVLGGPPALTIVHAWLELHRIAIRVGDSSISASCCTKSRRDFLLPYIN